jgi:steroid delta-isomerase-like uncharacterized protein
VTTEWVERYLAAWNSHEGGQVVAFMTEDVRYEDLAQGALYEGHTGVEAYIQGADEWSSDYRFVVVSSQSSEGRYAIEWEMLGTNTGDAGGFPRTNKPYRIRGTSVGRLDEAGRIAQNRDYWNYAAYLVEVGLLELPSS